MKLKSISLSVAFGLIGISASHVAVAQGSLVTQTVCARVCLKKFVDEYVAAMLKRDTAAISIASNVKVAENAAIIRLGEGMDWKTGKKFFSTPSSTQYVADTQSGEIARMGIIDLDGQPAFYAVRLKVVNSKITEIETLVGPESLARPFQPEGYLWREAPFIREIPATIRSSRAQLLKTAGTYWAVATTTHKGADVPYSVDCIHVENGMNTDWERPLDSIEAITPEENPVSMFDGRIWTCEREVNLTTRSFEKARGLRYLVDEERGLVMAWTIVDKVTGNAGGGGGMTQSVNGVQRTAPEYGPPSRGADGWPAQGGPGGGPGGAPGGGMAAGAPAAEQPSLYHAALVRIVNGKIHREQFFQVNVPRNSATPF
ncbi:MAG: hypothetical protein QM808_03960 [Steroidobacteraceae bacterium]